MLMLEITVGADIAGFLNFVYVLIGIGFIILLIMMVVKFFQIAADIRIIREKFFKHSNLSSQESNSKGDLNNPEVLSNLLSIIDQQSANKQ